MSTQVNTENPIFHRPATDTIPADVSLTQERINNGELLEEKKAAPVAEPAAEAVAEPEPIVIEPEPQGTAGNAADWTKTQGAGLTADTSASDTGAEYRHSSGEGSSKITPTVPVELPTQEQADAVVAKAAAGVDSRKFATEEKVTFSPESGNDTTEVFTIDGGELGEGPDAQWFWRLVEKPGSLFLGRNLQSTSPAEG